MLPPNTARIILWFIDLVSLAALFWAVNYLLELSNDVHTSQNQIELDGELYYALLITIAPVIHICRHFEVHHPKHPIAHYSGGIIIGSFMALLILVNALNFGSQYWLESNGFRKAATTDHKSYVRGERSIWVRGTTQEKDQP